MPSSNPGAAVTTTLNTVPPQANLAKIQALSVNMGTVSSVAANTTAEQTFSGLGTGLLGGDVIVGINKPTAQAGLGIVGARVDASVADKFYVTFSNNTASPIVPTASEVYALIVGRPVSGSSTSAVI
jgi:TRAP-type mannitol/chloroaromatic compound transport system permease large subunit